MSNVILMSRFVPAVLRHGMWWFVNSARCQQLLHLWQQMTFFVLVEARENTRPERVTPLSQLQLLHIVWQ